MRFTGDDKYLKILHLILMIVGLLIVGGVIYKYLTDHLNIDLYLSLFLGISAIAAGLSVIFGYSKPMSAIIIDDEGIRSDSVMESSFKWSKLKKVELEKKRIHLQYAQSGITDYIRIPFTLRFKNLDRLSNALSTICVKKNVEFINKLNKKQ